MKMKKPIHTLIFLLAIPAVLAKDLSESVGESLYKIFGFIFVDFSKRAGTPLFYFYIKFLLWILLFAALFYATRFVFKEQKRIQIAVAFIVAMLSVIMIPDHVVVWIVKGYSIVGAFMLLATPIIGVILLNHYAFSKPERAFYAIKAVIYYLLAMLIYNVTNVVAHYDLLAYRGDQWIGFAEGVCILLMLWNIFKAIFPGGGEEKAPEGSIWDTLKGKPEAKAAEVLPKGAEEAKEAEAKKKAEKEEKEKEKLDRLADETFKKEKELEDEINKLMQRIQELNNALAKLGELERKNLQERREALKLILRLIEAIESAYNKLKEIDDELKKGKIVNSKELQKYKSRLIEYIRQGLQKINALFEGVSKSVLDEYSRILDKKKVSDEALSGIKKVVKRYTDLKKLEELDTKLNRFIKSIEDRLYRLQKRTKSTIKIQDRRAIINSVTLLLDKLKTIQKEVLSLIKALREETKYMNKFEIEDRKKIEEQRKTEEKNKTLLNTIRDVLNKLLIEPSSKLFKSLKDKINEMYKNTELEENDVISEENYESKLSEFIAKWKELDKRKKEVDKIKEKIELELHKLPRDVIADMGGNI